MSQIGRRRAARNRRALASSATAGLLGAVVALVTGLLAASPAAGAIVDYEVVAAGSPTYFTVTANVTSLRFTVDGASGGSGESATPQGSGAPGGLGAEVSARIVMGRGIRVGDVLALYPGTKGGSPDSGNPLAGGRGGPGTPSQGAGGGGGGGGSGVLDMTSHRWLLVAGGGGGASGTGAYDAGGMPGGDADAPGRSSRDGSGGALNAGCPELDANPALLSGGAGGASGAGLLDGGGGGGGGGCYGGSGGAAGGFGSSGGSGGGGRSWNFYAALDVTRGLAPRGNGLVKLVVSIYREPAPTILSPDHFDCTVGQPVVDDFVASGTPPPDLHVSGTFPKGEIGRASCRERV